MLLSQGLLNENQLQTILAAQAATPAGQVRKRLGSLVIELGMATEKQVAEALAEALALPLVDLGRTPLVPGHVPRRCRLARAEHTAAVALSRRRALGVLGLLGAGGAGMVELIRSTAGPAPRPKVAVGTTRLVEQYAAGARQLGEWWVPPGSGSGPLPTVVLVHGGYWRASYDRHLEDAVAADLAGAGHLVWNLEYAASDAPWPATLTDVAAGYDFLMRGRYAKRVDPARLAVVGHSAGGHLALFLASRGRLPAGAPGAGPHQAPALVIPQAPVAALALGSKEGLGGGAVDALLGGSPAKVPQRYAVADPVALLPSGVRSVLVHGTADDVVPMSQSTTYRDAALAAGDNCRLVQVQGGHFEHLDPTSGAWAAVRAALTTLPP